MANRPPFHSSPLVVLILLLSAGAHNTPEASAAAAKSHQREGIPSGGTDASKVVDSEVGAFKAFGTFKLHSQSCSRSSTGGPCLRRKRSLLQGDEPELSLEIRAEKRLPASFASAPSPEDDDEEEDSHHAAATLRARLRRSVGLVAPHFQLIVRDDDQVAYVNSTVPFPTCLYEGEAETGGEDVAKISASTCREGRLNGLILSGGRSLVVEELHERHPEFANRPKRSLGHHDDDADGHVVIYESTASGGECGIKPKNAKRMRAPQITAVELDNEGNVKDFDDVEEEDEEVEPRSSSPFFKRRRRRRKRAAAAASKPDKAIELAVFVDDDLYAKEKETASGDPIAAVKDLVFTYLNSVQLLYNSERLDTQFRIVLVRLEVFRSRLSSINKGRGDVETYLDSFCSWQKVEKTSKITFQDDGDAGYWDHGLLLTGLNLYDGQPRYDTVIGLAWVSGMCDDSYSCTINEGSNYESVYVIAHEMGHNLGMNHDGETAEGNNCNPDKFLMSPVLGPGKVTWSTCSNDELEKFLAGRKTILGRPGRLNKARCLDDLPEVMRKYDYLREEQAPGDKVKAIDQCRKAFGTKFVPHVRQDEKPFEDLCRELWCANSTHALRAHPALEGTDCSSKPYPYGSICRGGSCTPFDPNDPIVPTYGSDGRGEEEENEVDVGDKSPPKPADEETPAIPVDRDKDRDFDEGDDEEEEVDNEVDVGGGGGESDVDSNDGTAEPYVEGRPVWYDPIFTKVFNNLKLKHSQRYSGENGKVRVLPVGKTLRRDEANYFVEFPQQAKSWGRPRWVVTEEQCPVQCGGVSVSCDESGSLVEEEKCDASLRPRATKTTCNLDPCGSKDSAPER